MLKINKAITAVVAAFSLGLANTSVAAAQQVGREEMALIATVDDAETQVLQQGFSESVDVARPSMAKTTNEGVVGFTGFGEISVSFGDSVQLEDVVQTEYATDTKAGAVARASGEVGTLMQAEEVAKHEDFVEVEWNISMPDGVETVAFNDGSIGFRLDTGDGVSAISETVISAPWAVDEGGNLLDTWYEISEDGSSLKQVVNTQEVEGEIVLDPRVTYGRGVYYNWYGGELRALKAAGTGSLALAVGYGCAKVGNLRHPAIVAIAGLLCLTAGSTVALWSLKTALDNLKNINDGTCYQWKVGSNEIKTVSARGNCGP